MFDKEKHVLKVRCVAYRMKWGIKIQPKMKKFNLGVLFNCFKNHLGLIIKFDINIY